MDLDGQAYCCVLKRRARYLLILFLCGLVLNGITAFLLMWEVGVLESMFG